MNLRIANDIGNAETKMIINKEVLKQPSVIKRVLTSPNVNETNIARNIENLYENLYVNIASKSIKRSGSFFIGKRANITANSENMNITLGNKHKHDIPVIMTLGMVAANAVKSSYYETKKLSTSLSVDAVMTTAIPASEYNPEKAKELETRFLSESHVVTVFIGEDPVVVTVNFDKVKVTQEGVPALYAILDSDKDILKEYIKVYEKDLNPKELKDKRILHADIGDGTTEYIYTIGLKPVTDACSGERRGVGHATQEAIRMLEEERNGQVKFNRQRFTQALRDPSDNNHEEAKRYMEEARYEQANLIFEDIQEKFITKTSNNAEIIAVYGGGSIQFKNELYGQLLDFAKDVRAEILWVPEEYAVNLNVNGMEFLNDKVLYKQKG